VWVGGIYTYHSVGLNFYKYCIKERGTEKEIKSWKKYLNPKFGNRVRHETTQMVCPSKKNGYKDTEIGLGKAQSKMVGHETTRHEGKKQLAKNKKHGLW
jgi:hypothetical protein